MRYPRDGVSIEYAVNDYADHYKDLNFFYKEYVGHDLHPAFISCTGMKNKYPIQVIDLSFQLDQFNTKKIQLHQAFRGATNNARLFMILIRHRKIHEFR